MMPKEWPLAAYAADRQVDAARTRGRSRLSTVRQDFFLDPAERLTEQERSLMTAMLSDLLATLANDIAFAAGQRNFRAQPASLCPPLMASGLVDRPGLVSLMLRRADEHSAASAFSGHAGPRRLSMLARMTGDSDPAVAAAAMALVVARGRRIDGFGQPRLELNDLERADAQVVAQAVAASIASEPGGDRAFSDAAARIAARADPAQSLERSTSDLIDVLEQAARDSDQLIEQAGGEGELSLLAHLLSRRAKLGIDVTWEHLKGIGQGGLALLARMAQLPRAVAARLIADLGAGLGTTAIGYEIEQFDSLDNEQVVIAQLHWQLPDDFRAARDQLDG